MASSSSSSLWFVDIASAKLLRRHWPDNNSWQQSNYFDGPLPSWDNRSAFSGHYDDGNVHSDVEDSDALVSQPCQHLWRKSSSQCNCCCLTICDQRRGTCYKDGNTSGGEGNKIDWDTEDDLEIENYPLSSCSSLSNPGGEVTAGSGEASSSTGPSNSKLIRHFVGMGFPEKMVAKAIEENGEGNTDSILETLLTYSALENSPQEQQHVDSDLGSSGYEENFLDDLSDTDSCPDLEDEVIPQAICTSVDVKRHPPNREVWCFVLASVDVYLILSSIPEVEAYGTLNAFNEKRYVKWTLKVASAHGQRAPLPFIKSVEEVFP